MVTHRPVIRTNRVCVNCWRRCGVEWCSDRRGKSGKPRERANERTMKSHAKLAAALVLLVGAVEQWCRDKGCQLIEVTSNDRRATAHAFYRHMGYEWLGIDKREIAIMTELLLRGAQTVGELRGHAARMEPIADLAALRVEVLVQGARPQLLL